MVDVDDEVEVLLDVDDVVVVEIVVVVVVVGATLSDPTATAEVCRLVPPLPN